MTCPGTGIYIKTFVQEGSPKTVGVPKLTLPDLPACYVGFYTLFDSVAVHFVFYISEIGLVKAKNRPAVQAPGCFLYFAGRISVARRAFFWVGLGPTKPLS